uniref:Photosystem I assembly protein Ycf4 n=1 Tax=Anotrichium furcellatum TaxID=41999 RepID=A0A4D6WLZ6_9FLOR|nr:photosystem I assembly protein Ycf4 [Anotrichium furcellatum]
MKDIKIDRIDGSRRLSNYFWANIILLGGTGFLLEGISSYLNTQLLPFINNSNLKFLPQGMIMTFYGTIALVTSIFMWYTIVLNVGSGYNEFNNATGIITIFRLGFPGKNRILKLEYSIENIKAIKVKIDDGLSPKQEIYLKTKDKREIPLTKVGEPIGIDKLEIQATYLAKFLGVNIEGI